MSEPLIAASAVDGDENGTEFAVLRQHLRLLTAPRRRGETVADRDEKLLGDTELANELEALFAAYDKLRAASPSSTDGDGRELFDDDALDRILDDLVVAAGGERGQTSPRLNIARWDLRAALRRERSRVRELPAGETGPGAESLPPDWNHAGELSAGETGNGEAFVTAHGPVPQSVVDAAIRSTHDWPPTGCMFTRCPHSETCEGEGGCMFPKDPAPAGESAEPGEGARS